jgi:hypothetical protein
MVGITETNMSVGSMQKYGEPCSPVASNLDLVDWFNATFALVQGYAAASASPYPTLYMPWWSGTDNSSDKVWDNAGSDAPYTDNWSAGDTYTASGLSGTAVSSTPSSIKLSSVANLPLTNAGTFTVPCSAGSGTVTLTYTGISGSNITGVTASGGTGKYTSNTLTCPTVVGTLLAIAAQTGSV